MPFSFRPSKARSTADLFLWSSGKSENKREKSSFILGAKDIENESLNENHSIKDSVANRIVIDPEYDSSGKKNNQKKC